jgi:Tfp pilus assembly protein PilO
MKKILPIVTWLGISLFSLLAVFAFILQLRSGADLNKELDAKKEELRDAQVASRKMEDMERKAQELKQKEKKMFKRVAINDAQPLELIKTITGLASQIGLRKLSFDLKSAGSPDSNVKKPAVHNQSGPSPVAFQMKAEASFAQLLSFLKGLNGLERVVTVEKIEISRQTEILPYQSVVLELVAYSFFE